MLTAAGSPLVGGHQSAQQMATKPTTLRVKVLRPFLLRLSRQEVGTEATLDRALALELVSANKVEILRDAPAAPPAPDKPAAKAKKE